MRPSVRSILEDLAVNGVHPAIRFIAVSLAFYASGLRSRSWVYLDHGPYRRALAGLAAGLAIAMQVGAVSLLLVEPAVVAGPRVGIAAGMGVATADLAFAAVAAGRRRRRRRPLSSHETEIRLIAAATLAAIALHGLSR